MSFKLLAVVSTAILSSSLQESLPRRILLKTKSARGMKIVQSLKKKKMICLVLVKSAKIPCKRFMSFFSNKYFKRS